MARGLLGLCVFQSVHASMSVGFYGKGFASELEGNEQPNLKVTFWLRVRKGAGPVLGEYSTVGEATARKMYTCILVHHFYIIVAADWSCSSATQRR